MGLRDNRGVAIISVYIAIVVLMAFGGIFFWRAYNENNLVLRHRLSTQAICIAEAGIERGIFNLQNDFQNYPTPSWRDSDIDGILTPGGPDSVNFYDLPYPDPAFGNGFYDVDLMNVGAETDHIRIRSTGTIEGISRTIEVYMMMEEVNIWNNAAFTGTGSPAGVLINGNVDIRGSVHLLGEGLTPADMAMDMGGGAYVGNNYDGMPASFASRVPALETTIVNGVVVETLNAKLRVKNGRVGLSGAAQVGEDNDDTNALKERVDGTYVTDGFTGSAGASSVFSDNGTRNRYDLGNRLEFPSLSDPYEAHGTYYDTYMEFLKKNAFIISDLHPDRLAQLANITPESDFDYIDTLNFPPKGRIGMDGNGNLFIAGIVYVDGGDVNMIKEKNRKTIEYTGWGSIVATGDVGIHVNLLTSGAFPTNIIGVMTPGEINFNEANIDVMGLFYGETRVRSQKQTDVAGTFVSNYFDMGTNVPSIFQVPTTARRLPPGMIGGDAIWLSVIVAWREVPNP